MGVDVSVTVGVKVGTGVIVGGISDGCTKSYVSMASGGTPKKDRVGGIKVDCIAVGVDSEIIGKIAGSKATTAMQIAKIPTMATVAGIELFGLELFSMNKYG